MAVRVFCSACDEFIKDVEAGELQRLTGKEKCEDCGKKIRELSKELDVLERMNAWTYTIDNIKIKKDSLILLKLDISKGMIHVSQYKNNPSGRRKSTEDYSKEEEKHHDDPKYDVVLVGAENISDLKNGYRNYFADTQEFLKYLRKIINPPD